VIRNISSYASRTLFLICVLDLCALPMRSQTANTGAIAGTVSDPNGALVAGAALVVKSQATQEQRDLITDAEGRFLVQFLAPGKYDLTIRASGFEPLILNNVQVRITEISRLKIELTISSARAQITISAKSLLLQTDNATLGRVIDRNTVEEMPLVNRNFTEILGLTAGTNTDIVDATQLGAGSQEIRTNGARSGDNNFMLNGVDANSYGSNITEVTPFGGAGIAIPAPDTIQEFKVQTSLYDAQYGRGGGANVNVETRSGTADLHGNVYYFGRNEALNANNFFANATGVPRGKFRHSQPGFTLGGPMPWLTRRVFFFVSYQATRDVNAAALSSSVRSLSLPPIPQVRTPPSLGAVFGGQTGLFGGVAVAPDGSNINPVALNLLNAKNPDGTFVIPSPQTSGNGVNFTAVEPGRYNEDQFNTNVDFNLRSADHLSVKFFFSNSNQDIPFFGATVPGFPALRSFENRNLAITETHIFSSRAINQFRFGFSRLAGRGVAGGTLTDTDVGINHFSDPQEQIIPQIQVLGAFQLGSSSIERGQTAGNNFYISDVISLSRSKHDLRLGTEIFRNQFNQLINNTAGIMILLSFPDFLIGLPAAPAGEGGNGTPLSNIFASGVTAGILNVGARASAAHFFALDGWKVTRTLTMNLGIRVEVNGQQSEVRGRQANFFPQFYVPPPAGGFGDPISSGFVLPDNFPGDVPDGFPRTNSTLLNHPIQVHPEPRIGFAWQPFSSKNLVLRGGYGIYANRLSFKGNSSELIFNPPFTLSAVLTAGANASASFQNPFPSLPPNSSFPNFVANILPGPPFTGNRFLRTATIADPDLKETTVQHFGIDLQYQHKSYLFSIAYAGAKGTHLALGRGNNQPALASPSNPVNGLTTNSVANATERVPFIGLNPLEFRLETSGNSIYNSLQVTLKTDNTHRFHFLAAYTFSKSIDDAGDGLGAAIGGGFGIPILGQFVYNDQRNDLSLSALHYVIRTRECVVLDDASISSPYLEDKYVLKNRLRSVLCLPIVQQTKLVGALYLENKLTPRAFTPDRVALLELLASQAAISLQNARLYSDLQRSEAFLAEGQSISLTGSFGWNVSTGEIYWSEQTYQIFGFDPATKPSSELIEQRTHPDDRDLVRNIIDRATKERTNFDFEHRLVMPNGAVKHVHVIAHCLQDSTDNLEFVGAVMDVTSTRQGEEALRKAQADLAHVSRVTTMGELVASIAHEVNQPLGAIVTNGSACVRLLSDEAPDVNRAREVVGRMITDGIRASEVIKRIRDLLHKAPLEKVALNINETVQEVMAVVSSEVRRSKVELLTALAADLPPVVGDRIQLQQVILNLILNARDAMSEVHTHPREVLVTTVISKFGEVVVAVRDFGKGLAAKDVERIFDPFFTTKPEGMGLGLSISRTIIQAHGGRLWATPNDDRGATIQFTLPPIQW
jgi:PAS domain S-box-containing protein